MISTYGRNRLCKDQTSVTFSKLFDQAGNLLDKLEAHLILFGPFFALPSEALDISITKYIKTDLQYILKMVSDTIPFDLTLAPTFALDLIFLVS